jgi:hypothetical protein
MSLKLNVLCAVANFLLLLTHRSYPVRSFNLYTHYSVKGNTTIVAPVSMTTSTWVDFIVSNRFLQLTFSFAFPRRVLLYIYDIHILEDVKNIFKFFGNGNGAAGMRGFLEGKLMIIW